MPSGDDNTRNSFNFKPMGKTKVWESDPASEDLFIVNKKSCDPQNP